MSTALTKAPTKAQLELVRRTVAKGATDDQLKMFFHVAQKSGLDPFRKEIYFYKVPSRDGGEDTVIMTSRDGFLSIAQRSGELTGINSASIREKDEFSIDYSPDGIRISHKITSANAATRGPLVGAWARVYRAKFTEPTVVFVDNATYNKGMRSWKTHPDAMLIKCAESIALKKLFGISGLVSSEEMGFDPSEQEEKQPENVLFKTIVQTIERVADPVQRSTLAEREIAENKVLTDAQKQELQKFVIKKVESQKGKKKS